MKAHINPYTVTAPHQFRYILLGLSLLAPLLFGACQSENIESVSAQSTVMIPASEHLEVTFEEPSMLAVMRLRAESCSGVDGPWRGRATSEGLVMGQSDIAFTLASGAPSDLDVVMPVTGAVNGEARGRLHITPLSYPSPIDGALPTHQLRITGSISLISGDAAGGLPSLDLFLTARPLTGSCSR